MSDIAFDTPIEDLAAMARPEQARQRTFQITQNGQKIWIKQAERKSYSIAPVFQRAVETSRMPTVLRCTHIFNREAALWFEGQRLRHLAKAGHPVPQVLAQSRERLVLSDTGISVWQALRDGASPMLAEAAGAALARLHNAGEYHGQPYPKNMTWDGERIGFIDFEENALAVMSLPNAQLRDVWMMAHGHWPFAKAMPDIAARVVNSYAAVAHPSRCKVIADGVNMLAGAYTRTVHAGAGWNVRDNLRRYEWTLRSVRAGLAGRLTA